MNREKSDIHFEGETIPNEVTSYRAFGSGDEEPPADHTYDYTVALWNCNGVQEPTSVEVNYHE